jgi:hypothetical protein
MSLTKSFIICAFHQKMLTEIKSKRMGWEKHSDGMRKVRNGIIVGKPEEWNQF